MIFYSQFDTIIFDLGNTILPISPQRTISEFNKIGLENNILQAHPLLLERYQRGEISSDLFISEVQNILEQNVAEDIIISAWNAMLLDYPPQNINLLRQLKNNHTLILLSNTNELHYQAFSQKAQNQGFDLDALFHHTYYSHQIGISKPHPKIFEHIIEKHSIDVSKTLFLDDLEENILTAQKLNICTFHITENRNILELK